MRKVVPFIVLLILIPSLCFGASVSFAWKKNPEPDVVKYRIYCSLISGLYAEGYDENAAVVIDQYSENKTTATIEGLTPGLRYYFVITAVNSAGLESGFSNELAITIGVDNPNPTTTAFDPDPPVLFAMIGMTLT